MTVICVTDGCPERGNGRKLDNDPDSPTIAYAYCGVCGQRADIT